MINATSQILGKLPERILRVDREELVGRRMDEKLLTVAKERHCHINLPGHLCQICTIQQSPLSWSYGAFGRSRQRIHGWGMVLHIEFDFSVRIG